jgi:hypothetical protein
MFDNLTFNPAETYRKLLDNAEAIEKQSQKVTAKRTEVNLLEATLLDAKADSFTKRRAESGITEAKEWQKIDCLQEEKDLKRGETELRNLMDEMRVLEAVNANYKMAVKMAQIEIGNLNLQ